MFGRPFKGSPREPCKGTGSSRREDDDFRRFGSLSDHGRKRCKGGGADKVFGTTLEHNLDPMSDRDEFADNLGGAERALSRSDGEKDQGPALAGRA